MRNEILRDLQGEYEQRRARNDAENRRRLDEVSARSPEAAALLRERQELIYSGVRGILQGGGSYDDLPVRMELINSRITAAVKAIGLPADYLQPVCTCPLCRDTGYVGEPVREMCACLRSEFNARLYRRVGLGEQTEQSFERFDERIFPDKPIPGMPFTQRELALVDRKLCREWAEKYPDGPKDLLLLGQSGLGKTYLLHCMAKVLLDRGFNVLLLSAYRYLDIARKAYFSGSTADLDSLMETDVLMVDDLGSEPFMENITVVQFFNLINERQTAGRATVFSTNLTMKELRERYTERVASRLTEGDQCRHVRFYGDDVRRKG